MPEDSNIDRSSSADAEYYGLIDVIRTQVDLLYYLNEVEYEALYDEGKDDKIKCVVDCFKVISAAQKAMLKHIKSLQ